MVDPLAPIPAYPARTADCGIVIIVEAGRQVPAMVAAIVPGDGASRWTVTGRSGEIVLAKNHKFGVDDLRALFDLERQARLKLVNAAQLHEYLAAQGAAE